MDKQPIFKAWPKIQRYDEGISIVITEKIDGTNACIIVDEGKVLGIQSRKRLITPDKDNMGFASWVTEHEEQLATLGTGYHFGEWAGPGIQKNPLGLEQKEFFLFNPFRHNEEYFNWLNPQLSRGKVQSVPLLYQGKYTPGIVESTFEELDANTEYKPEGVMIYFPKADSYIKHVVNKPHGGN